MDFKVGLPLENTGNPDHQVRVHLLILTYIPYIVISVALKHKCLFKPVLHNEKVFYYVFVFWLCTNLYTC